MDDRAIPTWVRTSLLTASAYFFICGLSAWLAPSLWWLAAGLPIQDVPILMEAIGALMLALSVGSLLAALTPRSQWVAVAILASACGIDALIVGWNLLLQRLPMVNGTLFLLLDLVLLSTFLCILGWQYRCALDQEFPKEAAPLPSALDCRPHGADLSIRELSENAPLALVFIRHAGCTFCRYHLELLGKEKQANGLRDSQIVLVGMSPIEDLLKMRNLYGLDNALVYSDPQRHLYRAFGLRIGTFLKLLGPKQIYAALRTGALKRHGIGWLQGSGFQLGGVVVISKGKVVASHLAETVSDYCTVRPLLEPKS